MQKKIKDDRIPVGYQFTQLAPLLRLLGEQCGEKLASKSG